MCGHAVCTLDEGTSRGEIQPLLCEALTPGLLLPKDTMAPKRPAAALLASSHCLRHTGPATSGSVFAALSASNSLPACPHAYFLWVLTQNSPLGYALPCPSLYFLSPFSASLFLNTGHETCCIFYHLSDLSVFPPLKCKLHFISSVQ